ncbi:uncharacterized protein LOC127855029 isoform X4 [Dreissena polymorpha]|uniref:uncharacterized protein LOC127855029 isoform X4 n=1 Tax=Dreissena polymorpha TaxID=45954 RepID=UPI002264F64B|nr:uncharacterized protein LOC127855029 isoform X4 [Dreissena polymorpha]
MSRNSVPGPRTTPMKVRCRREEYRPDEIPTRDHNSRRLISTDRNRLASARVRRSFPFSNQTRISKRVPPRSHSEERCVTRKQSPIRSSSRRFSASVERCHNLSIPNQTRNNSATFSSVSLPSSTNERNTLAEHIFNFWKHGRLCDVILHAGGKSFHAHRLVLAASCDKLAHFSENGKQLIEYEIPGASSSAIQDALVFFYTSNIDISEENVQDLLHIAHTLGSEQLKNICAQYLSMASLSNAFANRTIALRFGLLDVVKEVDEYLRSISDSLIQSDVFLNSEFNRLYDIISSNILTNLNDLQIFHACTRWIAHKQSQRIVYAPALMELVRFANISPQDIVTHCEPNAAIFDIPECKNMLFYAFRHHALNSQVTDSSSYGFKRSKTYIQSEHNYAQLPTQNIELSPFPSPGANSRDDGNEATEKVMQDTSVSSSETSSASKSFTKSLKMVKSSSSATSSENFETDNLESSKSTEQTKQQLAEEKMERVRSYVGNVPTDAFVFDTRDISANNVDALVSKLSGISLKTLQQNKVSRKDLASYRDFKNESKKKEKNESELSNNLSNEYEIHSEDLKQNETESMPSLFRNRFLRTARKIGASLKMKKPGSGLSGEEIYERQPHSDQGYIDSLQTQGYIDSLQTQELQQRSKPSIVKLSPIPLDGGDSEKHDSQSRQTLPRFEPKRSGTSEQGYHDAQAPYDTRHVIDLQRHYDHRQSQHSVVQLSPLSSEMERSRRSTLRVPRRDSQYLDKRRSEGRSEHRRPTMDKCLSVIMENVQIQPIRDGCNIPRKSSTSAAYAARISSKRELHPGSVARLNCSGTVSRDDDTNESPAKMCRSRRMISSSSLGSNCTRLLPNVPTTPPPPPPLPLFPVVIVAGVSNRNVPMSLYQFDPLENNWSNLTQLPFQVHYAAVSCLNDNIYVTGGRIKSSNSETSVKECNFYNIFSGRWTKMTPMKTARAHHTSVTLNGLLYVIGGEDCVMMSLKNVEMYDTETGAWTTIATLRDARVGPAAVAHRGRIYVAGGILDTDEQFLLDSFEVYDPRCRAWSLRSPLPTALCDASLAEVDGVLCLVGGYVMKDKRRISQSSVYRFCDETDTWQEVFTLSVPRHRAVVVAIDARMFVIGGESADPESYDKVLTSVESIDITGSCKNATYTSLPEALVGLAGCVMHGN